ncbi:hypothetical protein V8C37DRAFT_353418 [Trichoderma ceciliae]
MTPLNIVLTEEGDSSGSLRTKNASGEKARSVLIDRGNSLILQAALVSVTHGEFTPEGAAASLLIFEFTFVGKGSRRFTKASITLNFDDARRENRNRPVVWAISPSGSYAINKSVSTRDVNQSLNIDIGGSVLGMNGGVGYVWDTSETKDIQHSTKLVGLKRTLADGGKNNAVVWILEEDSKKKDGIPTFLRSGVLLRRRDDVPFNYIITASTEVDFGGKILRLFGHEKPDPIDPVELDEETDLDALGISTLGPETPGLDLNNMRDMDIGKYSHVILASLLNIPG